MDQRSEINLFIFMSLSNVLFSKEKKNLTVLQVQELQKRKSCRRKNWLRIRECKTYFFGIQEEIFFALKKSLWIKLSYLMKDFSGKKLAKKFFFAKISFLKKRI